MPLKMKHLQPVLPVGPLYGDSAIAPLPAVFAAARAGSDLRLRHIPPRRKDLWASPKNWQERTRPR